MQYLDTAATAVSISLRERIKGMRRKKGKKGRKRGGKLDVTRLRDGIIFRLGMNQKPNTASLEATPGSTVIYQI